ncbi:lysine transporter LysE [Robbsia andropogonis]|uniref:Lysine transporter LysE n=1 Tax=Robbsia andropogonis TaxID=28092 RepID=A0A0F5K0R8_9BURK|nr:LysE family translocator [Robbsia andropogonis]KKB63711.1 lysine transporter LysE [Robbsia andropogonis]MCP1119273.1 LysE family translocator [Robbsia andropogonis]MCP1129113.1 LysE family translocator [Robbsia andropogonis]
MSFHAWLFFLPACFALNMSFGPNNVLSVSNGARSGIMHAVWASSGRLLAFTVMITITGLGLSTLLLASATLFTILKLGGAAYLIWIGIRLLRSRPIDMLAATASSHHTQRTLSQDFKQEFYVAAGNPKAILIFTAFLPQFVDRTHYASSFTVIGATFLALEWVAIAIYAAIGARLRSLAKHPKGFRWLNRASGAMMVSFGILLAMVRRPVA